jgi:hypothetical protein
MDELIKYKRKLIFNLILLLSMSIISLILVIGATPSFKDNWFGLFLLALFLIEIPVILILGAIGINSINTSIEREEKFIASSFDELEKLEKEVEEKAQEADNLTLNLNRLSEDIKGFKNWEDFGSILLKAISNQIEIVVGIVYYYSPADKLYKPAAEYAYYSTEPPLDFEKGSGLAGQVVKDKKSLFINNIPEGYVQVISGLGSHKPKYLAIIPIIDKEEVIGVVEIATFKSIEAGVVRRADEIAEFFGKKASGLSYNNETINK